MEVDYLNVVQQHYKLVYLFILYILDSNVCVF